MSAPLPGYDVSRQFHYLLNYLHPGYTFFNRYYATSSAHDSINAFETTSRNEQYDSLVPCHFTLVHESKQTGIASRTRRLCKHTRKPGKFFLGCENLFVRNSNAKTAAHTNKLY